MHEHIFMDMSVFWDPASEELHDSALSTAPLDPLQGGAARWNMTAFRDNLIREPKDFDLLSDEIGEFVQAGGGCIVDLTNRGLRPAPSHLAKLAADVGVHIVAGCGFYVHPTHPEWLDSARAEEIAVLLLSDIKEGFDGSDGVRPGIIGEIGVSDPIEPCEENVLRAAAWVAVDAGLSINIHLDTTSLETVSRVVRILEEEGHDLSRTVIHHLDEVSDTSFLREVLQQGVVLGFEGFGSEGYFNPRWKLTDDMTKMEAMSTLAGEGFLTQFTIAQDISAKCRLHRFGGLGYDHVLRRVVPRLRGSFGFSQEDIHTLLVSTPERLLTVSQA